MSTAISFEDFLGTDSKIEIPGIGSGFRLPVFVVFTSTDQTMKALEKARQLAHSLQTRIEVIAVQTVPFVLPLDEPPVPFEFVIRRFEEMTGRMSDGTSISAYLCRNAFETLKRILRSDCPVVMGIRKRWWWTRDQRLARKLNRAGFKLVLVKGE